jgi:enoyl-CoA hydratase/carnithine racemase
MRAKGRAQAAALAAQAPDAVRTTRALLRRWPQGAVAEAVRAEWVEFARLLHGPQAQEALTAFQEKRAPDFGGVAA